MDHGWVKCFESFYINKVFYPVQAVERLWYFWTQLCYMVTEAEIFIQIDPKKFKTRFIAFVMHSLDRFYQIWIYWMSNLITIKHDSTMIRVNLFTVRISVELSKFRHLRKGNLFSEIDVFCGLIFWK